MQRKARKPAARKWTIAQAKVALRAMGLELGQAVCELEGYKFITKYWVQAIGSGAAELLDAREIAAVLNGERELNLTF